MIGEFISVGSYLTSLPTLDSSSPLAQPHHAAGGAVLTHSYFQVPLPWLFNGAYCLMDYPIVHVALADLVFFPTSPFML